jgi:hypothetical protein
MQKRMVKHDTKFHQRVNKMYLALKLEYKESLDFVGTTVEIHHHERWMTTLH